MLIEFWDCADLVKHDWYGRSQTAFNSPVGDRVGRELLGPLLPVRGHHLGVELDGLVLELVAGHGLQTCTVWNTSSCNFFWKTYGTFSHLGFCAISGKSANFIVLESFPTIMWIPGEIRETYAEKKRIERTWSAIFCENLLTHFWKLVQRSAKFQRFSRIIV